MIVDGHVAGVLATAYASDSILCHPCMGRKAHGMEELSASILTTCINIPYTTQVPDADVQSHTMECLSSQRRLHTS